MECSNRPKRGLGPGRLGGEGRPAFSRLASTGVSPSPVPQTPPGYRIRRSVCTAGEDRPAGDPKVSPLCPPSAIITTPSRPRQWPSREKWCGRRWEEGSLPTGGHKHLCAANLRTETGCSDVARGQEWDRRATRGDQRQSGRASRTTLLGKRATSTRDRAASTSADHVRTPMSLGSYSPDATVTREESTGWPPAGATTRRAAPRGRARDSRLRLRGPGRALRRGIPRPRCPLAVPRDRRLLQRRREAASRARDASAAERKASAAAAGPRTLSSWMSRSVDLSMERN